MMRGIVTSIFFSVAFSRCNILTNPTSACLLPFPDNFWRTNNTDNTVSQLTLDNSSLPVDASGNGIDPDLGGYNQLTGFSALGPILAYLPGLNLDKSSLPRLWDISTSASSKGSTNGGGGGSGPSSLLLDVETETALLHWVELDESGDTFTPYERALITWPASRLRDNALHIVAFRDLVDDDGVPIARSDGFDALVRGTPTDDPALELQRPRFEMIFNALEARGWPRANLTLAWDFTTATTEDVTSRFISMRDDALARVEKAGGAIRFQITSVEALPAANTSRRVHGQFWAPCYLPFNAIPSLDSRLVLDPVTRLPVYQNDVAFDFELVIPLSVAAAGIPVPVLQYGHGLFGDHGEVEENYLATFAQEHGYVLVATDEIGLSEYDAPTLVIMMAGGDGGFSDFRIVPDRLHQGMLNAIILMRLVTSPAFVTNVNVTFGGKQVISTAPGDRFYTGNSQGGIMGGVYMATSPDVTRGVLGVGGGPYAMLLPRSSDFAELFDLLKIRYPRSVDRMIILGLMQALWDRMDPAGWAGYITKPVDNSPPRRVVMHYGEINSAQCEYAGMIWYLISRPPPPSPPHPPPTPPPPPLGLGDHQVTWLGAHAIGKTMGARMFASNVREGNESLSYFETVPDNSILTDGNVIMGFDFGFPINPFINVPPSTGPDAHECPRRSQQGQAQMAHFFATGEIINTCEGACILKGCPSG